MNSPSTIIHREWHHPMVLPVVVAAALLMAASAQAVDGNSSPSGSKSSNASDLTGLSLTELYNLDVVQPNVLGGHTHPAGESMIGYRFMHTHMSGLYDGSTKISPAQAFAKGFSTVHISMEMDMHMIEVMHAPTERLTLMAMMPFVKMSMVHMRSNNTQFPQSTSGFGDAELMALYTVKGDIRSGGSRVVLNMGVSLPTGSINAKDHAGGDHTQPHILLEYFMQHGSGTFDLRPGVTYLGESGQWAWGAQTLGTFRIGRNNHGYSFGDQYRASTWVSYGVTDWFAPSLRLDGSWWEDVDGVEPGLAGNTTPEGRADLRGGRRLDFLMGVNFYSSSGKLKGNRLIIEGGVPVYQHLDGPQLGTSWMLNVSWSYAF